MIQRLTAGISAGHVYLTVFVVCLLSYFLARKRRSPLPPGPKGVPVLGNLLQMPTEYEWLTFSKWGEIYGPVFSLKVLGQNILVLNTLEAAKDLLDKRSSIYSSRPRLVMAGELVGFAEALALMPYSPKFHKIRRLLHKEMTGVELAKYATLHEQEAYSLVRTVIREPSRLIDSIRHYAGSVILKVSFGYQTEPKNDPFLVLAEKVMGVFAASSQPGAWLVDLIPPLKRIPSWIPGTSFKKTAAKWRKLHMEVIDGPYDWAKAHQNSPALTKPNFTSTMLEKWNDQATLEEDDTLKWAAASLFGGGADTTVSALSSFFLLMASNPDVQHRAQQELDLTLHGRLPTLSDRLNLPYIDCILLEVLRWHPVAPLGVPHLLTQEDEYRGCSIPDRTIVIANIWNMLHDPLVFSDPKIFRPERFLDNPSATAIVRDAAFGFGRRACPGMNFAESSMFIAIATSLALTSISNPQGSRNCDVDDTWPYTSGTISHPKPFTCKISYRSQTHADLLETF